MSGGGARGPLAATDGGSGPSGPAPIREVGRIGRATFDAEIRPAGQPVILRGLGADWPAVAAARRSADDAVAYLKRFSRPDPVNAIVGEPGIEGRFFYADETLSSFNFTRGRSPLDPFLDRLLRDRDAPRPYAMAVQSIPAPELLPGFAEENATDLLDRAVTPRLWLGNAIRVATHFDLKENIGVVLVGRRRFTVFPPDQLANLYMGPLDPTPAGTPVSLVDPVAPDLVRFPRYAEAMAVAQAGELEPGDAIYLPYHWWHAVDSLEPVNVFMNYWWNPAPAALGNPHGALLAALHALRGLPDDQRAVWKTMFDHFVFHANGDPVAHIPPSAQGVLGDAGPLELERMRAILAQSFQKAS